MSSFSYSSLSSFLRCCQFVSISISLYLYFVNFSSFSLFFLRVFLFFPSSSTSSYTSSFSFFFPPLMTVVAARLY